MKTLDEKKQEILESMEILIQDGETLCTSNEGDFSEFAETNNYDLELVKEVYEENKFFLEDPCYQKKLLEEK